MLTDRQLIEDTIIKMCDRASFHLLRTLGTDTLLIERFGKPLNDFFSKIGSLVDKFSPSNSSHSTYEKRKEYENNDLLLKTFEPMVKIIANQPDIDDAKPLVGLKKNKFNKKAQKKNQAEFMNTMGDLATKFEDMCSVGGALLKEANELKKLE